MCPCQEVLRNIARSFSDNALSISCAASYSKLSLRTASPGLIVLLFTFFFHLFFHSNLNKLGGLVENTIRSYSDVM